MICSENEKPNVNDRAIGHGNASDLGNGHAIDCDLKRIGAIRILTLTGSETECVNDVKPIGIDVSGEMRSDYENDSLNGWGTWSDENWNGCDCDSLNVSGYVSDYESDYCSLIRYQ